MQSGGNSGKKTKTKQNMQSLLCENISRYNVFQNGRFLFRLSYRQTFYISCLYTFVHQGLVQTLSTREVMLDHCFWYQKGGLPARVRKLRTSPHPRYSRLSVGYPGSLLQLCLSGESLCIAFVEHM